MNENNLRKCAEELVKKRNSSNIKGIFAGNVYENFVGGVLVDVTFINENGENSINHVIFPENNAKPIVGIHFSDVCYFVSRHKDRPFLLKFLDAVGVDGLIALVITIMFGMLLFIFAISGRADSSTILEIVKISLTLILGYFFGNRVGKKD